MAHDLQILHPGLCSLTQGSDYISGAERIAQKFVIELLTVRGSMRFMAQRGCSFLTRLRRTMRSEYDVIVAFAAAKEEVKRCLRDDESVDTPLDERCLAVQLSQIMIEPGAVTLELAIKTRAGTIVRVLTPPIRL